MFGFPNTILSFICYLFNANYIYTLIPKLFVMNIGGWGDNNSLSTHSHLSKYVKSGYPKKKKNVKSGLSLVQ